MKRRASSYLTVTDQFCGAGGSSIGATAAGLEVRMAMNHWQLAIDTHQSNFPATDHDCADVSACDPRRYPATDILITSPECTNHSLAKGARRKNAGQRTLFGESIDPAAERSRATMWDVVRFAETHAYRIIVVENVVDVRFWGLWDVWLQAMAALGYRRRLVSLNSMHAHPTPQSRDRLYVVFWRKGNRAPDLDVRPQAPCPKCGEVEAQQAWKANSRTGAPNDAGRYKRQYVFTCPTCRREVTPYYYAALNAIDWALPAERIGDRKRPLKVRTMDRIRFGLEKYGRTPLMVTTNMTTDKGRVRAVDEPGFTQTGSSLTALASPFLVETGFSTGGDRRVSGGAEPCPTQTTRQTAALAMPFLTSVNYFDDRTAPVAGPWHTQTTQTKFGVTIPPFLVTAGSRTTSAAEVGAAVPNLTGSERFGLVSPFLVTLRRNMDGQSPAEPLATVCAGAQHHAIVQGAALMATWERSPFLVSYYQARAASGVGDAVPTVTTLDRHGVVEPGPELRVEDCFFRMLQPHEIQAAMAFPGSYKVLGNARDRVKQLGNAVTPPAMAWLIERCVASLHPEVRR